MNILVLAKKYPYPTRDGESIAIHTLAKGLQAAGARLDLLSMNPLRDTVSTPEEGQAVQCFDRVYTSRVDNRVTPQGALKSLLSGTSYHVDRFICTAFREKLIRVLRERTYNWIQLETTYLTPYIPVIREYSTAKIALRAHNIEHEIWARIVANTGFGLKKLYLHHLTRQLRAYEQTQLRKIDLLAAISDRDARQFEQIGCTAPILTIPIGMDTQCYPMKKQEEEPPRSLFFIGSMDWMPNLEGVEWFREDIWPLLRQKFPNMNWTIAGRKMPPHILGWEGSEGIEVPGEVADAAAAIQAHPVMLVPLLSGSGMRVKILEALALGRVVLTTTIGLEGIPARHKEEVMVADTAAEMVAALRFLGDQPRRMAEIGQNARNFVVQQFDYHEIGRQLHDAYLAH